MSETIADIAKKEALYKDELRMTVFENSAKAILCACGEDHSGVKETPKRFARAMREMLSGYFVNESDENNLKTFDNVKSSSMISMMGIGFCSFCEHHMVPFFGKAYIGYIPNPDINSVLGASKIIRVLRSFSNRFQVQERIGESVVEWLDYNLNLGKEGGCICILKAQHMCIGQRGVRDMFSFMETSAIRGAFADSAVRNEFMQLVLLSETSNR